MISLRKCTMCGEVFEAQVGTPDMICDNCLAGKPAKRPWLMESKVRSPDSWYEEDYKAIEEDIKNMFQEGDQEELSEDDLLMEEIEKELTDFPDTFGGSRNLTSDTPKDNHPMEITKTRPMTKKPQKPRRNGVITQSRTNPYQTLANTHSKKAKTNIKKEITDDSSV